MIIVSSRNLFLCLFSLPLFAPFAELGEGAFYQFVPLGLHVPEGGGDEQADDMLLRDFTFLV